MRKQYDFSKAKRAPVVKVPKGKTRITIRLDEEILEWFRQQVDAAGGGSYQSLINDALKHCSSSSAGRRKWWVPPVGKHSEATDLREVARGQEQRRSTG